MTTDDRPVAWRRRENIGNHGMVWVYYETDVWPDAEPLYDRPAPQPDIMAAVDWSRVTEVIGEYADGYDCDGDGGTIVPNEQERFLITDACHGLLEYIKDETGYTLRAALATQRDVVK